MKLFAKGFFLLLGLGSSLIYAQSMAPNTTSFQHVVVIVQENRTPDNLFQGLCTSPTICNSVNPSTSQYDIQTSNWLDNAVPGGVIQPLTVQLANSYDLSHAHSAWVAQCDKNPTSGLCQMDGAAGVHCSGTCPSQPQFRFVDNSSGILNPYLTLATSYGWANYMFQTNQGPSFPAHQFIFGGTSAPSSDEDHNGTYASENMSGTGTGAGCVAQPGVLVQLIDSTGTEDPNNKVYPCFEHQTVSDLAIPSWRYYTPGAGSIWSAPDAIIHICGPDGNGHCTGTDWKDNVDPTNPADFLTDVASPTCKLKAVTWIIPTAANSDHANINTGGGPGWVASLVNAIGNNTCTNPDGSSFWDTTAIFITWDDWGGWYDHEVPTILGSPFGGYQKGFRVPLLVVSAFTGPNTINNRRHDFGSIIRFIEQNFGITEGFLTFADSTARSNTDLTAFFNLTAPRNFVTIPGATSAATLLAQPVAGPDDDDD